MAHHNQEQEQVSARPIRIKKPSLKLLELRASESNKQQSPQQRRKAKATPKATARQRSKEPEAMQDIQESNDFQDILELDK